MLILVMFVISGVPQGSVLGPILFILFVNDIDTVCHSSTKLKLYADDLKLYSVVESVSTLSYDDLKGLLIMLLSGLTHGSSL